MVMVMCLANERGNRIVGVVCHARMVAHREARRRLFAPPVGACVGTFVALLDAHAGRILHHVVLALRLALHFAQVGPKLGKRVVLSRIEVCVILVND